MFLRQKIDKPGQIQSEDLFLEITMFSGRNNYDYLFGTKNRQNRVRFKLKTFFLKITMKN